METIKWDTTKEEDVLISSIVERAVKLKLIKKNKENQSDLMMDLTATHSNGNPLDFEKLLTFDNFNFIHDIFGIMDNIDRSNGQLASGFMPRCTKIL